MKWQISYSESDFYKGKNCKNTFDYICKSKWSSNQLLLLSQPKSGKTHLAHIWKKRKNALFINPNIKFTDQPIIIDEVDKLLNHSWTMNTYFYAKAKSIPTLWISNKNISEWTAPYDIISRFESMPKVKFNDLTEQSAIPIVQKQFRDFGLHASRKLAAYLLQKISLNYESIHSSIIQIHNNCLLTQSALTMQIIRDTIC